MLKDLDVNGIYLKTLFDGYDFIHTEIGQRLIPSNKFAMIYKTTYIDKLENAEQFIDYCKYNDNGYLPKDLMTKYNCGSYSLSQVCDDKNPGKGSYILFNSKLLTQLFNTLPELRKDIEFWVCPAYNEQNQIEAIGFRIKNEKDVLGAFKWIFTCGNNIIYGKNTVDKEKPCYIVEGYRDYIALNESGYNCIGLGSVVISKKQEEYIKTLKDPIILLDNDSFGLKKTMQYKDKYRVATLIGTEEKDAWDTYSKGISIKIAEIK